MENPKEQDTITDDGVVLDSAVPSYWLVNKKPSSKGFFGACINLLLCLNDEDPRASFMSRCFAYKHRKLAHWLCERYTTQLRSQVPQWDPDAHQFHLAFGRDLYDQGCSRHTGVTGTVDSSINGVDNRNTILHVIPNVEVGGSQKIIWDIMRGLGGNFRFEVLTGKASLCGSYPVDKVKVAHTKDQIKYWLQTIRPDLIHLHYWGANDFWVPFQEAINLDQNECPMIENVNTPVPAFQHERIRRYVAVSRLVSGLPGQVGLKMDIVYPGIDEKIWSVENQGVDRPPTIGMVYRLERDKLRPDTMEILTAILKRMPSSQALVVGDGTLLPFFEQASKKYGVRERIHWVGGVKYDALPMLYDRMDLFLAPLQAESFGVVVPYAMAKGIPVLAFGVDAIPEVLQDERCICATPEDMVRKAASWLSNRSVAKKVGMELVSKAKRFQLGVMLQQYKSLYMDCLKPT